MIVGIDPGVKNGVAIFDNGRLLALKTLDFFDLLDLIKTGPKLVVLEDSTLQSFIFTAPKISLAAAKKVVRNIGEVDAFCKIIKLSCGMQNIAYKSVSPKDKGAKIDSVSFKKLTGWDKSSNQHERDAAMTAWKFKRFYEE